MTEFDLTPAQSGVCDEMSADPVQMLETGSVVAKEAGTGKLFEIDPKGEATEFTEALEDPAPDLDLDPAEMAAEIIDGTAEEVPAPEDVDADDLEASKPDEHSMMVDTRGDRQEIRHEVVRAMDRADEALILSEIQGATLKTFVYSFEQGGDELTDLTVAGVNEVIRLMNERGGCQIGIDSRPPIVEELTEGGKEKVRVMVFSHDSRRPGTGRWAVATEPKKMRKRNGDEIEDKFAMTKALNKAQRNALKMQIPESFRQTIIATFKQDPASVQVLEPVGAGPVAQLPQPDDSPEATQLLREIEEVRDKIYVYDRVVALNPARYNAWLSNVTHDQGRMRDFKAHLEQILEKLEEQAAEKEAKS